MGLADRVLDNGLSVLDTEATHLNICAGVPTTFSEATTSGNKKLGNKAISIGVPADASPNGRFVTVPLITDGTVSTNGTATHWALTDNTNSRLLATGSLAGSIVIPSGVSGFILNSFTITIPASA